MNTIETAKNGKTFIERPAGSHSIGERVHFRTSDITEAGDYSEAELAAMSPRQRRRAQNSVVVGQIDRGFVIEGVGEEYWSGIHKMDVCRYYGYEDNRES